jgi:hypothetical protein
MAGKYFSPYAPRRRRSAQLVIVWLTLFVVILWLTWYYTSGGKGGAMSDAAERIRPGRGLNGAPYAGAGAGAGEGE